MSNETRKCIEAIAKSVNDLKASLDKELAQVEDNFKNRSGDIHTKVAERRLLAVNLKLDKKLIEIWEEVRSYPFLCKRDTWVKDRLCEIDFPQSHKSDKEFHVAFTLNGHGYKFNYYDGGTSTLPDGDFFHHTRLSLHDETDKILIQIKASVDYDYGIRSLKPFEVSAFIPGIWIQDFLECYERFQANKNLCDLKKRYNDTEISDLRQRFGID